eukprot:6458254-Amphidinium_carterae.1
MLFLLYGYATGEVVIFVKSVKRALALDGILRESNFPSLTLHELPKQFQHKADPKDTLKQASRIERQLVDGHWHFVVSRCCALPKTCRKPFCSKTQHDVCTVSLVRARKDFKKRILVTTDLFGRGMDVERVNIVINFDIPADDAALVVFFLTSTFATTTLGTSTP